MKTSQAGTSSRAWYHSTRADFLSHSKEVIANQLVGRAIADHLEIHQEQAEEWQASVALLQSHLADRIPLLRAALSGTAGEQVHQVILEYDFRRRGLRLDCVLLCPGVVFVIEFKRSRILAEDREQVMRYAVNLVEFHSVTRRWCELDAGRLVPIIALTSGRAQSAPSPPSFGAHSWDAIADQPIEADAATLSDAIHLGLASRSTEATVDPVAWIQSEFSPSSSILDAAISLYGSHDVSAIKEHAVSVDEITRCVAEVEERLDGALESGRRVVVLVSGAPGAGKTLVGLDLVLKGRHAPNSVFVTGNAPLVSVLQAALNRSYRRRGNPKQAWPASGYRRKDAKLVADLATFKIVTAHKFLEHKISLHKQADGRVLVFDEAQRTYQKGRTVQRKKLSDHEADLILIAQERSFPNGGTAVVALVGHNQAINKGELGILAWLESARRRGWDIEVSDETLKLGELDTPSEWIAVRNHKLTASHLSHSMRFYRNAGIEKWAGAILTDRVSEATEIAGQLASTGNNVWLTRSIETARRWARTRSVGEERTGIVASSQARRLAAEGLHVNLKPSIDDWMLAPNGDIRASSSLETVQNEFQIQGLELDYTIVCWDIDLRRERNGWSAWSISGPDWQSSKRIDIARNCYRVLLTRARKGMVIFVPRGDEAGVDITRPRTRYDEVADYLTACGAQALPEL